MSHSNIQGPTLLLRPSISKRNIQRMLAKAAKAGLRLRPHFKTHQAHGVGRWFRDAGVSAITASSIEMAEYFAKDDWNDILIAFPVNIREMERLNRLAAAVRLTLIVDHLHTLQALNSGLDHQVHLAVEIDCGDGRTGVPSDQTQRVLDLSKAIMEAPRLTFAGWVTHAGHSYSEIRTANPQDWFATLMGPLHALRAAFQEQFPRQTLRLSYGDTPSCSLLNSFEGIDELRPGNFVFFDLVQEHIGSCQLNDIAVAMAVPVVSVRENTVVVHGGGVHFAKDSLDTGLFPMEHPRHFGWVVQPGPKGWLPLPCHYLKGISQEHGEVHFPVSQQHPLPQIGDLLYILPVHSCMTADLMMSYRLWDNGQLGNSIPMMKSGHAKR